MDSRSEITQSPIFRIVAAQLTTTLIAAALSLLYDRVAAWSACLAGLVSIVPGIYSLLIYRGMSQRPARPGETGLRHALRGELGRYGLIMVLFAGVFALVKPLNVLVFFGTFALLQALYGLVPLVEARRLIRN